MGGTTGELGPTGKYLRTNFVLGAPFNAKRSCHRIHPSLGKASTSHCDDKARNARAALKG